MSPRERAQNISMCSHFRSSKSGIENVVAFLTENVTALQLEQLAALIFNPGIPRKATT